MTTPHPPICRTVYERAKSAMAATPHGTYLRRPTLDDRWLVFKNPNGPWWIVVCAAPGVSAGVNRSAAWGVAGSMDAAFRLVESLYEAVEVTR